MTKPADPGPAPAAEQFKALVTHAADGILVVDADGVLRFVNPAGERILGRPAAELLGTHLGQPIVENEPTELAVLRKDGSLVEVDLRAAHITWEGAPAVVASLRDISRLKQEQRAHAENEARLAVAQQLGRIGHWELDLVTRELRWSDMVFTIYGRDPRLGPPTPEEEAGYYAPEVAERLRACSMRTLETGEPYEVEVPVNRPDGRVVELVAVGSATRDATGKIVGLLGTVQDVTERNQAKVRALRLNAVLGALRNVNQLIFKERHRERLLERATNVLVETRCYASASLVHTGDAGQALIAAHRSSGAGPRESTVRTLRSAGLTSCMRNAVTSSAPIVVACDTPECSACPLHTVHADQRRMASALRHEHRTFGAITVALPAGVRMAPEELDLLEEMASDLAFALHSIAMEEEHRRTETERSKLSLGIERTRDAIFMTDRAGSIVFVNPAFERLYGFSRAEAIGRTPHLLEAHLPPQDSQYDRGFWAQLRAKQVIERELTYQTKGGQLVQVTASANPILDERGDLIGFLAIHHDITEKRGAQAALERSRRELRQMVDKAPDGIVITRGGTIVYANPAFAALGGDSDASKMIGVDILSLVPSEAREAALRRFREEDERAISAPLTGPLVRSDGEVLTLEFSPGQLIEFEGAPAHLTVCRDVTERNKLQAQLQVADRMTSVGMLAAGVAHEINNPLAAAMMNIEMASDLVDELQKQPTFASSGQLGECSEMLSDARDATERVREIVRDLKIFARSEEDRRGAVDLHRMLDSTLRMAWNEIRHRARLVKDFGKIPPVCGNEARLGQVFLNLVVNAAQAIPEGRAESNEIRVLTRTGEDGRVVVEVRDTGPGMPPEILRQLFTPFFTTKPIGQGTGLGLSICHRIVSGFGGNIEVESEVGRGSVFRVRLPPQQPESGGSLPTPSGSIGGWPATRRGRILVIDDEVAVGRAVQRILKEHEVTVSSSATDALVSIRGGERYDVIICDVMMPEVTGMEFYALLGNVAPDLVERVVFLTGGAFTSVARRFLDEIPNSRLEKPFDGQTLRLLVRDRVKALPLESKS